MPAPLPTSDSQGSSTGVPPCTSSPFVRSARQKPCPDMFRGRLNKPPFPGALFAGGLLSSHRRESWNRPRAAVHSAWPMPCVASPCRRRFLPGDRSATSLPTRRAVSITRVGRTGTERSSRGLARLRRARPPRLTRQSSGKRGHSLIGPARRRWNPAAPSSPSRCGAVPPHTVDLSARGRGPS